MRCLRAIRALGRAAAALVVAFGVSTGSARAASVVDVTYDLSDSRLVWEAFGGKTFPVSNTDPFSANGIVSGQMKVRYTSDSSSRMPIVHGPATLLSFNLTVESLALAYVKRTTSGNIQYDTSPDVTGTLHWQLTSPVTGSFKSSYRLATTGSANFLMTGRVNCRRTFSFCRRSFGIPSFTIYPNYSHSGPVTLAGADGPYGGANYTTHTLLGKIRGIRWRPGAALVGLASDVYDAHRLGGVFPVGREILREAEGHPPRPIPEPATVVLLGGALIGVASIGCMKRRRAS